jgi:nitrogen fixation protein FixH
MRQAPRPFTGRHITAILIAFFAVVITVNVTMARFALSSFGGTVVDNSYVASQRYNDWLARADAQARLGWDRTVRVAPDRHVRLELRKAGVLLKGPRVTATLSHPLGRAPATPMHFTVRADGALYSVETLPVGRWRLDVSVRHGQDEARYREDLK